MNEGISSVTKLAGYSEVQFDFRLTSLLERSIAIDYINLFQIGDMSCDRDYYLNPHQQRCFEITYVVAGKGSFFVNEEKLEVGAGDIVLHRPGDWHKGEGECAHPMRFYYMGFLMNERATGEIKDMMVTMLRKNEKILVKDKLGLQYPFAQALKEISANDPLSNDMLRTYLEQIIMITYRNFYGQWHSSYPENLQIKHSKLAVRNAIEWMEQSILEVKDLNQLAQQVGYSLSHFSAIFKDEVGMSLQSYVMNLKWRKAEQLLKQRHLITNVAEKMNYSSIHTFSRAFKKHFGKSPSEYVNQIKG